jgi:hypothetical protein
MTDKAKLCIEFKRAWRGSRLAFLTTHLAVVELTVILAIGIIGAAPQAKARGLERALSELCVEREFRTLHHI